MSQALKSAIEEVTNVIEARLREVAELKRSVNALCHQAGLAPQYTDTDLDQDANRRVVLHRDTYYGRPLATAMREHLEAQRHAVTIQDLLAALEQGGFDFEAINWTPENRLRNLAISLSKNPFFKRLPSGVVGLKSWYDDSTKEPSGQRVTKKKTIARRKHAERKATKAPKHTKSLKGAERSTTKTEPRGRDTASVKDQSNAVKKTTGKPEKIAADGQAQAEHIH